MDLQVIRKSIAAEIGKLQKAYAALGGVTTNGQPKRRMSAAGRRKISRAQRARWAKMRKAKAA